jgi:hypothetical protein
MRQLTVNIPEESFDKFMALCQQIPDVSVAEKKEDDVPLWQQEMVLERIKNAKPEDYIDANEALNSMKKKYDI